MAPPRVPGHVGSQRFDGPRRCATAGGDSLSDSSKQYDDKQVSLILKRAAEMQTTEGGVKPGATGLSLAELEQIAIEAGIDPTHVRLAAAEVDRDPTSGGEWSWLLGAPAKLRIHRVVDAEVPDDFFDDLLVEIQTADIGHGTASHVGRTLTWKGGGTGQNADSAQITITSRDGRTELHAERNRTQTAVGLMAGMAGGGGVGVGVGMGIPLGLEALGSPLAAVLIPAGVLAAAYVGARSLFRGGHRRHMRRMERLLDKLVERIQDEANRRLESDAQPSTLPRSASGALPPPPEPPSA